MRSDSQESPEDSSRRLTAAEPDVELNFADDDRPSERAGETIGRYVLVREIGRGGFGAVWAAEQLEPVRRSVALKIIKLGMDTRQVVARFEQERQALALMDHAHVSRVLDAGATSTGRPYFVMDLVRGEPIDAYCDNRRLTIAERLELFGQICNAVQHAHGKGIIHRDLKPSNVLVGEQDGRPHATVIDFGIAKATSPGTAYGVPMTAQTQVVGTKQYMSPEQAEGSLDIDTRSDVYSLGVLLYEILTGSTPFERQAVGRAMFAEVRRMIREVEPEKPSSRITESGDTLPSLARARGVEPGRLGSLIRGELDWIVMKAIEKDRSRRYETASALGLDIRRLLDGEAVLAAPPSAMYRLGKLIRRNKAAVAAAAAVAGSLVAGAAAFAWQADVAEQERDAARLAQSAEIKERIRAEKSEIKANAINKFLLDMLGSADMRAFGREAKVSQALEKASAAVGTAFKDDPDVEGAVRGILGKTYISLGMIDEAAPHVEIALALVGRVQGEESADYARRLGDRASIARLRGDDATAAAGYERALAIAVKAEGADQPLALFMRGDYANSLARLKREPEAEKLLREVLATVRRLSGRESRETLVLVNSIAVLAHKQGRLEEAETLYRESLKIGEDVLGEDEPDTQISRMNLGGLLKERGRRDEARELLEESFAGIKSAFGDLHPKTGEAAWVMGGLHFDAGRFKEARPYLEECLAIRKKYEGAGSRGVADAGLKLATALMRLGDYRQAATLEQDAIAVLTPLDGPDSRSVIDARVRHANTLVPAGRTSEAEALFAALLEQCPRVLGEDDKLAVITTNSFAVLRMSQGRFAEAEPYLKLALERGRRAQGIDHIDTLATQYNQSCVLRELGRLDEAESVGRDVLARYERTIGSAHANLAVVRGSLGETLVKLGRHDEAQNEFERAVAVAKRALGAENPAFTNHARSLAALLIDTGRADKALPVLEDAIDVLLASRGAADRRTLNARIDLSRCLTALGRFAEAEPILLDSRAKLPADDAAGRKDFRRSARLLAELYEAWNKAEPDATRSAKAVEWRATSEASAATESKPAGVP